MGGHPADYYLLLKVSQNASAEEIRLAFLQLARELHPDLSTAKGDIEQFKLVRQAYEVLIDPVRRLRYDQRVSALDHRVTPVPPRPADRPGASPSSVPRREETSRVGDAGHSFRAGQAAAHVTSSVNRYWRSSGQINRRGEMAIAGLVVVLVVLANLCVDFSAALQRGNRVAAAGRPKTRSPQGPSAARRDPVEAESERPAPLAGDGTDRAEDHVRDNPSEDAHAKPAARLEMGGSANFISTDVVDRTAETRVQSTAKPLRSQTVVETAHVFEMGADARERDEVRQFYEKVLPDLLSAIPAESLYADVDDGAGPHFQPVDVDEKFDPADSIEWGLMPTPVDHSFSKGGAVSRQVPRDTAPSSAMSGLASPPGHWSVPDPQPFSPPWETFSREPAVGTGTLSRAGSISEPNVTSAPLGTAAPHPTFFNPSTDRGPYPPPAAPGNYRSREAGERSVQSSSLARSSGEVAPHYWRSPGRSDESDPTFSPGFVSRRGRTPFTATETHPDPNPISRTFGSAWGTGRETPPFDAAWQSFPRQGQARGNAAATSRRLPHPQDFYRDATPNPLPRPLSTVFPGAASVPSRGW